MTRPWDTFFNNAAKELFASKGLIIDIGGGLRAVKGKGNRYDARRAWLAPLVAAADYRVLDPVSDYEPDIVGDIHQLPLEDASVDGIICLAVLEHVEDPAQAVREMHRALKAGRQALVYVPFLFYYHAEQGYYKDYWRFTHDALDLLFKDFAKREYAAVGGALESWIMLSPLGRSQLIKNIAYLLDRATGKLASKQVSGYYISLTK